MMTKPSLPARHFVPTRSVLLLVAVFIHTCNGSRALNSRISALQRKQSSSKLIHRNVHDLHRPNTQKPIEDTAHSHSSNQHAGDYGNVTALWDFFQSEKMDPSASSTLPQRITNSTQFEYNDQLAPLWLTDTPRGVRNGGIAPMVHRTKRQFEKFTQYVDEATFKMYEECTSKRYRSYVGKQKNLNPEPVLFQEGQSVTLKCNMCIRPDQDPTSYEISWSAKLIVQKHEAMVKIDDERYSKKDAFSLHIRGLRVDDAGIYTCYKNDLASWAYKVDILPTELREIVTEPEMGGRAPAGRQAFLHHNIKLYTRWSKWSECSRCNVQGVRRKIGICTVTKLIEKLNKPNYHVFRVYKNGIPCRSTLMPPEIAKVTEVRNRPSEMLLGYCNVPCATPQPIVKRIKDLLGESFIDVIKPGKEYVRYFDIRPTVPPLVVRKTFYVPEMGSITLKCPHDYGDTVRWQNATRIIRPVRLRLRERGRVLIDDNYSLLFRKLRPSDSGLYGCWVNGHHTVSIKLFVTDPESVSYYDYVAIAGLICSLLLVLFIGLGMVHIGKQKKGRKQPPYINPKQARAVGL